MNHKVYIYGLLFVLFSISAISAVFAFKYANEYDSLAKNTKYLEIAETIQSTNEKERLRSIALLLHENSISDAANDSTTIYNLFELCVALSLVIIFIMYLYHRDNISNKSSNLTGAKNAPPS